MGIASYAALYPYMQSKNPFTTSDDEDKTTRSKSAAELTALGDKLFNSNTDNSELIAARDKAALGAITNPFALQQAKAQGEAAGEQRYNELLQNVQSPQAQNVPYQPVSALNMPDVPNRPNPQVNGLAALLAGIGGVVAPTYAGQFGAEPIQAAITHADQSYKDELNKYNMLLHQSLEKHQAELTDANRKTASDQWNADRAYTSSVADQRLQMEKARSAGSAIGALNTAQGIGQAGQDAQTAAESGVQASSLDEKIKSDAAQGKENRATGLALIKEGIKVDDSDQSDATARAKLASDAAMRKAISDNTLAMKKYGIDTQAATRSKAIDAQNMRSANNIEAHMARLDKQIAARNAYLSKSSGLMTPEERMVINEAGAADRLYRMQLASLTKMKGEIYSGKRYGALPKDFDINQDPGYIDAVNTTEQFKAKAEQAADAEKAVISNANARRLQSQPSTQPSPARSKGPLTQDAFNAAMKASNGDKQKARQMLINDGWDLNGTGRQR